MPLSSFSWLGPSGRNASRSGSSGALMSSALGSSSDSSSETRDFDEEARKIFSSLGVTGTGGARYNACDAIWKHPGTGGTIYVGNVEAASNIDVLNAHRISNVVNCTDNMPLYHEGSSKIKYYRFDVAAHWRHAKDATSAVVFTRPVFEFIGEAVSRGENVLVHCLAGAHRAGTTGCACLMHFGGLDAKNAISVAKRLRSIIDPISTLPQLLGHLEKAYAKTPPAATYPAKHFS